MDPSRGTFIVLDGTEGSGKSTQARMLHQRLAQALGPDNVLLVRDPGTTRIGEQVRSLLLNPDHAEMNMRCEMLLYMAARAQMMAQTILPALAHGRVVVCDRFVSSTLAYQLGGDGLTAGDIVAVADIAVRGRWPDLTILLDMPARSSMARVNREKDRIEQRPLEYHEQVRKNYLAQAERDPQRYRVIAADRDVQEVHEQVFATAWMQVVSHRNQR
jgi:dTMP kinase